MIVIIKKNINVFSIPGPSSITSALSISGLPTDSFYFCGFLPKKKGRKAKLEFLSQLPTTLVFFEAPYRVVKTLNDIYNVMGDRIECGTFCVAAALTEGNLKIKGFNPKLINTELNILKQTGAKIQLKKDE